MNGHERLRILQFLVFLALWEGLMSDRIYSQVTGARSFTSGYEKGINIDRWRTLLAYDYAFACDTRLTFLDQITASRLTVSPIERRWKDQHNLSFSLRWLLFPNWSIGADGGSYFFSDGQTGYDNDIRTNTILAGLEFSNGTMDIPLRVGLKEDSRFGLRDVGLTYNLSLSLPDLSTGEYRHQLQAAHGSDLLGRRRNQGLSATYLVSRQFQPGTADSLLLSMDSQRNDYYLSSEGTVESRLEKRRSLENRLHYLVNSNLRFRFYSTVSWRDLNIDLLREQSSSLKRSRDDFATNLAAGFFYRSRGLAGELILRRSSSEEKYKLVQAQPSSPFSGSNLLATPDSRSIDTRMLLRLRWRLGLSDSLDMVASVRKYQYDTPSENNFDDRDELRYHINLEEHHRLAENLNSSLTLELHLLHLVYIYGQRSADNNWTRVIRLKPSVTWRPSSRVGLSQSAEVLANYVSYDFEDFFPTVKSFLYRKFTLIDSAQVRLSDHLNLRGLYRLELDENGKFLWSSWEEQPLLNRTSHTIDVEIEHTLWGHISLVPGYSYFTRKGLQYVIYAALATTRDRTTFFQSYGPRITLRYLSDSLYWNLTASSVLTRITENRPRRLIRLSVNCQLFL